MLPAYACLYLLLTHATYTLSISLSHMWLTDWTGWTWAGAGREETGGGLQNSCLSDKHTAVPDKDRNMGRKRKTHVACVSVPSCNAKDMWWHYCVILVPLCHLCMHGLCVPSLLSLSIAPTGIGFGHHATMACCRAGCCAHAHISSHASMCV